MRSADERRAALGFGASAETLAAAHLRLRGYAILERHYVVKAGEIDIVARRGDTVAFVEVKARPTIDEALVAVTPAKARRLSAACRHWLTRNEWAMAFTLRGDLVAVAPRRWPRHVEAAIELDLGHA